MHPYIHLGFTQIKVWNLFTFYISFMVGTALVLLNRPKDFPLARIKMMWGILIFSFMALIGAKLLHVLLNLEGYTGRPISEIFIRSGFAYPGALIFGVFGLWVYAGFFKVPVLLVFDYAAPYIILERVIGRFGCLMAGCCRGIPSNLPWAQNFGDGILRHPTQLYEMTAALSIFISLIATYPRLRQHRGLTFFMAITLYSFVRFFNEFLRVDSPIIFGSFHLSNFAMLSIFAAGLSGLYFVFQKASQKEEVKVGLIRISATFIISLAISLSLGILILSFFSPPAS